MTIPKWAYACSHGKNGIHTWCRTGVNEEFKCVNCNMILTKEEARDLGFESCNHYWKPIYPKLKLDIYSAGDISPKLEPIPKVCIHCGARY